MNEFSNFEVRDIKIAKDTLLVTTSITVSYHETDETHRNAKRENSAGEWIVSTLKNRNENSVDDTLIPLTKEKALAILGKFRKDLDIEGLHPTKQRIKSILEKSGPLSEEVTKMRLEET